MYLLGEGVEQSNQLAALWYNKAAQQGHEAATNNLLSLKRLMQQTGESIDLNEPVSVATAEPVKQNPVTTSVTTAPITPPAATSDAAIEAETVAVVEPDPVEVIANSPETDRDAFSTGQAADNPGENTDSAAATLTAAEADTSEPQEEAVVAEKSESKSGLGDFFASLFGSDAAEATDDVALAETEIKAEAALSDVEQNELAPEPEPAVKTFGFNDAPVSQPLSDTAQDEEVVTETVSPPTEVTASVEENTGSDTDTIRQNDSIELTDADAVADVSTQAEDEPGFFARLFGSGEKNIEPVEAMEVTEPASETVAAREEIEEEAAKANEAESETRLSDETTTDIAAADETSKPEPGFFSRLFGSGNVDRSEETTDATIAEPAGEVVADNNPDNQLAMNQQSEDSSVDETADFGFFETFLSGDSDQQNTEPVEEDTAAPATTESTEVVAVAEPATATVEPPPEPEPVEYITEFDPNRNSIDVGEIRPLAIQGDAQSQLLLADSYYQGQGVKRDYNQAFLWYRRAAQQGNVEAQYKLGNIYLMGEGVTQDDRQAASWYEKAAAQGHAAAKHNYENLQRLAASKPLAAATPKTEVAVVSQPTSLSATEITPVDIEDPHDEDLSVTTSTAASTTTAAAADKKGFWESAGELFGIGDEDSETSTATETEAVEVEDSFDEEQSRQQVAVKPESAESTTPGNDAEQSYAKGMAYAFGDGVRKNYKKAFEHFLQAAELGHPGAQYRLGVAYAYGEGVDPDITESINWYRQAAQSGNTTAQRTLASLYLDGTGVPRDPVMAHAWYRVVADSGNVMDVRRRDALQEELSEPELTESERIADEIHSRMRKL